MTLLRWLQGGCQIVVKKKKLYVLDRGGRGISTHRFSADSSIMKMKIIAQIRHWLIKVYHRAFLEALTHTVENNWHISIAFWSLLCVRMGGFGMTLAHLGCHEVQQQDTNIRACSWKDSLWRLAEWLWLESVKDLKSLQKGCATEHGPDLSKVLWSSFMSAGQVKRPRATFFFWLQSLSP